MWNNIESLTRVEYISLWAAAILGLASGLCGVVALSSKGRRVERIATRTTAYCGLVLGILGVLALGAHYRTEHLESVRKTTPPDILADLKADAPNSLYVQVFSKNLIP